MEKPYSPYRGYSLTEVRKAEATLWYIQIGKQFFDYDGQYLWEKEEAEQLFETLREGLQHMAESGNRKEVQDAREILFHFRLLPLRFV